MLEAGGRIELIVRMNETQSREEVTGCHVFWIMTGKECLEPESVECIFDYTGCRLECIALAPMIRGDVDTEFRNEEMAFPWPQATASHVLHAFEREDRPILNSARLLSGDFSFESRVNLRLGKALSRDKPGDSRVAPQTKRKGEIRPTPGTEAESSRLQKKIGHRSRAAKASKPPFSRLGSNRVHDVGLH